jgi:hypothetical protein
MSTCKVSFGVSILSDERRRYRKKKFVEIFAKKRDLKFFLQKHYLKILAKKVIIKFLQKEIIFEFLQKDYLTNCSKATWNTKRSFTN